MTKHLIYTAAFLCSSLTLSLADSKEEVTSAVKKLSEKANYSWTSTSKRPGDDGNSDDGRRRFRGGPTNGKTADGVVHLKMTFGDRSSETLIKGESVATKRDDSWVSAADRDREPSGDGQRRGRGGSARMYANYKAPAAQIEELLGKVTEIKTDGDVYVGKLSDEGAASMLSFGRGGRRGGGDGGGDRPAPEGVSASVKFWVKDGVLAKYETSVKGSISFNGNERDLSRVTTVELKDVGSTKIELSDEAKKALGS